MNPRMAVGLMAVVALTGCSHAPPTPTSPAPVVTATVELAGGDAAPTTRYSGTVRPHRQVALAFRVGGYVQSLLQVRDAGATLRPVQAGDTVTAGTILARVGSADYRAPVAAAADAAAAARANVSQAEAKTGAARAARRQALDAVTEARAALAAAQDQRAEAVAGIGQAEAAVTGAQVDAELAQDTDRRTEALFQDGSATLPQQQQARAADDGAVARLAAARQARDAARGHLAEAEAQIAACRARITEAQASVQAATAALAQSGAAVNAARAQAAQAQATQAAQAIPLEDATLRAPMTGTILTRTVEVGSLVGPGSVAFTLADTSRLDVVFGVPEAAARRLHAGQPMMLTLGDRDEITLPGAVTEVAPAADVGTGVFDVQVTAANRSGLGRPGMTATLTLPGGGAGDMSAPAVPLSAIVQSQDRPGGFAVVLVRSANGQTTAQRRDVGVGATFGDRIIVQGLQRGDRVVTSAPDQLYDGEPVQVTQPTSGGDDGGQ